MTSIDSLKVAYYSYVLPLLVAPTSSDQDYKRLFNIKDSKLAYEVIGSVSPMGRPQTVAEGAPIPEDQLYKGLEFNFTPVKRAILTQITAEAKFADPNQIGAEIAKDVRMAIESEEEQTAMDFLVNRAFTDLGGDGVTIANAAHPLGFLGETYSNTGTAAALTTVSIANAVTQLGLQEVRGRPKVVGGGFYLLCGPQTWFAAESILGTTQFAHASSNSSGAAFAASPAFAVNDTNVVKGRVPELIISPYITGSGWALVPRNKAEHSMLRVNRLPLTVMSGPSVITMSMHVATAKEWGYTHRDMLGTYINAGT